MSFGGSVWAMITSLKNNRQLLTSLRNRRRYAMQHHAEPKKIQKSKDRKAIDPKIIEEIKAKNKAAYQRSLRKRYWLAFIFVCIAIALFYYLFAFLEVIPI